jgi:branched-subunit amino acid ABC-type transport system permease component
VNVDLIALLAIQVLHAIASLTLISVGLTIIVGVMRVINPAHGAVCATRRPFADKAEMLF